MKTRFSDHNQFDSDHRLHCPVKLKMSYTHDVINLSFIGIDIQYIS